MPSRFLNDPTCTQTEIDAVWHEVPRTCLLMLKEEGWLRDDSRKYPCVVKTFGDKTLCIDVNLIILAGFSMESSRRFLRGELNCAKEVRVGN